MQQDGVFLGNRGRNANQSVVRRSPDFAESALAKQSAVAVVLTKKAQKAQMELVHNKSILARTRRIVWQRAPGQSMKGTLKRL